MAIIRILFTLPLVLLASINHTSAQQQSKSTPSTATTISEQLNTYLITREIPGAVNMSNTELQGISSKSCDVLEKMGADIEWVESFVATDHVFSIYRATNTELIEQHAQEAGFPFNPL